MPLKSFRGAVLYISKKPEKMDQERRREFFSPILQADSYRQTHYERVELSRD